MKQITKEIKDSRELWCFAGKVEVSIGDVFNWTGSYPGKYKVVCWGDHIGVYSPAGIGGTITVWVENEKGEHIEWCGDSVAHGIFMTKNPDHFKSGLALDKENK